MKEETYNNGKDLMPTDILVEEVRPFTGEPCFRAYLAFAPFSSSPSDGCKSVSDISSKLSNHPKFYMSTARDRKSAVNGLIRTMQDHLERLKVGDGFPDSL